MMIRFLPGFKTPSFAPSQQKSLKGIIFQTECSQQRHPQAANDARAYYIDAFIKNQAFEDDLTRKPDG